MEAKDIQISMYSSYMSEILKDKKELLCFYIRYYYYDFATFSFILV